MQVANGRQALFPFSSFGSPADPFPNRSWERGWKKQMLAMVKQHFIKNGMRRDFGIFYLKNSIISSEMEYFLIEIKSRLRGFGPARGRFQPAAVGDLGGNRRRAL